MFHDAAIYIPAPGSPLDNFLAPRAGIVGKPQDQCVLIYFEDDYFKSEDLRTWQSRLRSAANRMFTNYPKGGALAVSKIDSTLAYGFRTLVQVGELVPVASEDYTYLVNIDPSKLDAILAYTGETDLDVLAAPCSKKASFRLFDLARKLVSLQARLDEVTPKNGQACAPEETAVWDEAITKINAQLVLALPEIAATTGNSLSTLSEWFQPRLPHETWFGLQSNNQPAAYLANVARFQSMNPDRW